MAAKKSTAQKKTTARTAKTATKKAPKKKVTSATRGKTSAGAGRKEAKTPAKSAAKKSVVRRSPTTKTAKKGSAKKPTVSAAQVNLGHVFSLRPRVSTAFRPEDFRTAKHRLRNERYPSLDAAARAVVEQAHELGRETPRFAPKRP